MTSIIRFFKPNLQEQIRKLDSVEANKEVAVPILKETLKKFGDDIRKMNSQLAKSLVALEFKLSTSDPSYQFVSKAAKRVFDSANVITTNRDKILDHAEEYVLLTKTFVAKHIEVMCQRWDNHNMTLHIDDQNQLQFPHEIGEVKEVLKNQKTPNYDISGFHSLLDESGKLYHSFQRHNHDRNYMVSLVTDCPNKYPGRAGYHTWFRLTDDKGMVYSVGKFPDPFKFFETAEKHNADFCSADRQEWTSRKGNVKETTFFVSKETFDNIKQDIELDLQIAGSFGQHSAERQKNRDWNFVNQNCADWCLNKMAKYFIILEYEKKKLINQSKITTLEAMFPKPYHAFMKGLLNDSWSRFFIKGLVRFISRVNYPWKLCTIIMGASRRNPNNPFSTPLIKNSDDFFWGLFEITHPQLLQENLDKMFNNKEK